jgi:outer membrane protein OmpA-like peptidoglycan-associated protein
MCSLGRKMCAVLVVMTIATLAVASWAQSEKGKSAEDILKGLLGGERGVGRAGGTQTPGEEGRVALPIRFRYNSAEITPDSVEQLRQVATALNDPQLRSARIRVEGHTDNVGPAAFNQQLSERRAQAVKRYLVQEARIAAARIDARGYGKTQPLPDVSQDTEEGRALNRRVEFVNLGSVPVAATGGGAQPEVPAAGKPSVQVVVNFRRGGQSKVLAPGSVLTTNDSYRVTFTPNRQSFVYVYQISSDGRAEAVFPNPQYSPMTNPVTGRKRHVVPEGGKWLNVDTMPGDEEIIVLASDNALPDPQAVAMKTRLAATTRGLAPSARADLAGEPPADVAPADLFTYRLPFRRQ